MKDKIHPLDRCVMSTPSGTAVILIDSMGYPHLTRTCSAPWLVCEVMVVKVSGCTCGYSADRIFLCPETSGDER